MDDHLGILQQRVQAVAIKRRLAGQHGERMRRKIQQQEEEELDTGNDRARVCEQPAVDAMSQSQN